jgi:hypothetical protein
MGVRIVNIAVVEQEPQARTLRFYPALTSLEDGSVLLEEKYETTTDDEGVGTLELPVLENGSVRYDVELPGSNGKSTARVYVTPGDPIDLAELLALSGGMTDNIAAYITALLSTIDGGVIE